MSKSLDPRLPDLLYLGKDVENRLRAHATIDELPAEVVDPVVITDLKLDSVAQDIIWNAKPPADQEALDDAAFDRAWLHDSYPAQVDEKESVRHFWHAALKYARQDSSRWCFLCGARLVQKGLSSAWVCSGCGITKPEVASASAR